MGSKFGKNGTYNIIKIPIVKEGENAFDKASIECSIKIHRPLNPAYYHSFSMTDNYFLFIEQPLVISVPTLLSSNFTGASFADSLKWKPQYMVN